MAIVNFAVPQTLDKRVKAVVKEKGFPSRAELFRFAVMRYLDEVEEFSLDGNPRIAAMSRDLEVAFVRRVGSRKLPPLKKQLGRMKDL